MNHDDATTLNLDAYATQLDALLRDMVAAVPPASQQQLLAQRVQEVAAAIATLPPDGEAETVGDWVGSRAGGYVSVNGEAGSLVIALRGAGVAWVQGVRPDGVTWQFDYGPALSGMPGGGEARALRVRISRDLEVLSDLSFSPDGSARDERDWVGKMNEAWRELAEEARSVELPDTEVPGGMPGRAGAGRPKPPPSGGRTRAGEPLSGASAGMAAAAAAGLARAAAEARRSRPEEQGESRRCPRCGRENPPTNAFCSYCGARLEQEEPVASAPQPAAPVAPRRCARCGQPLPEGARFCAACGAAATTSPPSGDQAAGVRSCVRCGARLEPGVRFCPACGAAQESPRATSPSRCPHCGEVLQPGVRYCQHCGRPVNAR